MRRLSRSLGSVRAAAVIALAWSALLATQSVHAQSIIYVDASAPGNASGTTWTNAMTDIPTALAAATGGDEIWVAAGVYSAIALESGVALYGGFAGGELMRSDRDPAIHQVVLGDGLSDVNGHVVDGSAADASAVLDGFVIRGGVAPDDAVAGVGGAGGGVFIQNGSPTLIRCVITANKVRLGSGVMIIDGSPTFLECEIIANTSARSGEGGGIYAMTTAPPSQLLTLNGCTIGTNSVTQGHFATGNGGGIYCGPGVDLSVSGCTVESNFGFHNGTYGNATTGGGIWFGGDTAEVVDSRFVGNYAAFGAGIYALGDLTVINSEFMGNRAVAQGCGGPECNGAPDLPSGVGGALYGASVRVHGCTITANWAAKSAGGVAIDGIIENSILWGNLVAPVCCGEDPVLLLRKQVDGAVSIASSCVEGLLTQIPGEDPPDPANFPGSIDTDPLFIQASVVSESFGWITSLGDHHLQPGSPCIDSGDNAGCPVGVTTDLDGNPRYSDDPDAPDTGSGTAPIIDMGAYERAPAPLCSGDVDGDGDTDVFDFAELAANFGAGPGATQAMGDLNDDGFINVFDFSDLAADFGCSP